jgi:hypothetical protein
MVHAALLLLMLEAVHGPRFTISLKRSTQNLQLSTSCPADYLIFVLLTACRRDEAASASRGEIIGEDWIIPAARYKTGRDHLKRKACGDGD